MRGTRSAPATPAGETSLDTRRPKKRKAMVQPAKREMQESTPCPDQLPRAPAPTPERTSPSLQSTWTTPRARPSIQRANADSTTVASSRNSHYASSVSTGTNVQAHENTDLIDRFGATTIPSQSMAAQPLSSTLPNHAQQARSYAEEQTAPPSSFSNAPTTWSRDAAQDVQPRHNDPGVHHATAHRATSIMLPIQTNIPHAESEDRSHEMNQSVGGNLRERRLPSLLHDNKSTINTYFIECPPADGPLSPYNLSQPDTPSTRDFDSTPPSEMSSSARESREQYPLRNHDGNFLPSPQLPSPGFSLYHLPEENQTSATTLKKLPSMDHLVRQWDDGAEQRRMSHADTLGTDLGYLGRVIL
ncbi:MAG: hypothetical protein Q9174_003658 [Haloplaca sp. 1 TL-2023]